LSATGRSDVKIQLPFCTVKQSSTGRDSGQRFCCPC